MPAVPDMKLTKALTKAALKHGIGASETSDCQTPSYSLPFRPPAVAFLRDLIPSKGIILWLVVLHSHSS
jgi:hypothetical protein